MRGNVVNCLVVLLPECEHNIIDEKEAYDSAFNDYTGLLKGLL
jgi:hypothetical protein